MWNSIRDHLHSFIFRLFTICTIISLSTSAAFASTVGSLNNSVSFNFMNIAEFKASTNAYFSNSSASPEYMAISSLFGSFVNTFGPQYSYSITSNNTGTPASYFETKDVNKHLRDISSNQWYINQNISRLYDRYYTYSDGNAALLNQIYTNTTNMYGSQSATNVQLASLNRKFTESLWLDTSITPIYYSELGGSAATMPTGTINQNLYFRIGALRSYDTDLYMIKLPIQSNAARYYNSDSFTINFRFDYAPYDFINVDYEVNKTVDNTYSYLTFKVPAYGGMYIEIIPNYPLYIASSTLDPVKYMNIDSLGYSLLKIDYDVRNKDNQSAIVQAINDKEINIDGSGIEITGVIPIINTVVDKDIKLTVPITDNDLDNVSDTVNTLDDWTNTGVSISDALDGINDMLNVFFTSENRQIIETISNGYTDYYN